MAHDSAQGQLVLFGGRLQSLQGIAFSDETWLFDGTTWTLSTRPGPSARFDHAMAYDSLRRRTILFGGSTAAGFSAETWSWDGTNWTLLAVSGPPAQSRHAMAYDVDADRIVLLGTRLVGQQYVAETWEFDGSRWSQQDPAQVPMARFDHAMTFGMTATRRRVVVFGGRTAVTTLSSTRLGDTWEYSGGNWFQHNPATSPPPTEKHGMAYDTLRNRCVMYGGHAVAGASFPADTWEWDGSTWTNASTQGPRGRDSCAMAFDAVRGRTLMFGGSQSNELTTGDLWEWDGQQWMSGPSWLEREGHAMAFDATRNRTVLFGGCSVSQTAPAFGDTWLWDGNTWTSRRPAHAPEPRTGHAMAFDEVRGQVILFGGREATGRLREDTWAWDGDDWTLLAARGGPPARYEHAMAFDATRSYVLLFGGADATGSRDDTWTWNGAVWALQSPANRPSPRAGHALAHDSWRGHTVLHGGTPGGGETWGWTGSDWVETTVPASPVRQSHTLVYGRDRGRCVLFGGTANGVLSSATVEWDGAAWATRAPAAVPAPRTNHAAVYDTVRGRVVVHGGRSNGSFGVGAGTWEYVWCCEHVGPGQPGGSALSIDCSTSPVLGSNFCVTFDSPVSIGAIVISIGHCNLSQVLLLLPGLCGYVYAYPDRSQSVSVFVPGNPATYCIRIPASPVLRFLPVCMQGIAFDPSLCVRATDGLAVRVQ